MKTGPGGHILTGPIYVEGADSGDVLEVRFKSIKPAIDYACNSFGPRSGFLPEDFPGTSRTRIIELDTVAMLGHFGPDITIPLHPFFGSVGVAPPASMGRVNSAPPGIHAGNLDNKELVAGTTLYIPVWTKGALLEVGDGHAGQGNGEVDITAMETSLVGRLQLVVRKDMHLSWPRAETPTHYIAMGIDKDLTQATKLAVRQAIELLVQVKGHVARRCLPAGERRGRRRRHAARRRSGRRARDDPEGDLPPVNTAARPTGGGSRSIVAVGDAIMTRQKLPPWRILPSANDPGG